MSDRSFAAIRSLKPRRRARPAEASAAEGMPVSVSPAASGDVTRSSLVDSAVYIDGDRVASPRTLADTYQRLHHQPDGVAWIGLYRPSNNEIASLADAFHLHELAVEDAIMAHQRPKLDRYDDILFVVFHGAKYVDETEELEFGELHVFVGPDFVVTLRHSEAPDLSGVRRRLESNPDLLQLGPEAILYAIVDRVVDGYIPVVADLMNDIDEIEAQVFAGDPQVSRRIYELSGEVAEFQRATRPLAGVLTALMSGFDKYETDQELRRYLRDVADHLSDVIESVEGFRNSLRDMLTVNATLVAQQQNEEIKSMTSASYEQNEEVKKISAWAAILFAPTLVGTVYGMNFETMPELGWIWGYPFALALMAAVSCTLYVVFKRRNWL
jgi:magnesium transporter